MLLLIAHGFDHNIAHVLIALDDSAKVGRVYVAGHDGVGLAFYFLHELEMDAAADGGDFGFRIRDFLSGLLR